MPITVDCLFCNKRFDTDDLRRKYCSEQCRKGAVKLQYRNNSSGRIVNKDQFCIRCGKKISPERLSASRGQARTCSEECAKVLRKQQQTESRHRREAMQKGLTYEEYVNGLREWKHCNKELIEAKAYEDEIKAEQKRRTERHKESVKAKKQAVKDDAHAKKLGLSHGQYQALKYMNKLSEYEKRAKKKSKIENTYVSHIGCS